MDIYIRIFLILLLIAFSIIIIKRIKNKHLSLRYASIWMVVILILLILSIFPNIVIITASLLHFEAASNMVFLLGFFVLSYLAFSLTITISKQGEQIKELVEELSILKNKRYDSKKGDKND